MQPAKQNDMVSHSSSCKVSKNKHATDEDKSKQINSQIKIHNEHLENINKIEKYKKLNMSEHKKGTNITKTEKYKKLNSTSKTEHKADMTM